MGIEELRFASNQVVLRLFELARPVIGELLNQDSFTIVDGRHIDTKLLGSQTELLCPLHEGHHVRRAKKRLGGHTPTQDAETAERAFVDDRDFAAEVCCGARCCVARTATTNNDYIVLHFPIHFSMDRAPFDMIHFLRISLAA